jgi:branched-chain amino acid transport system substrate-binding protein
MRINAIASALTALLATSGAGLAEPADKISDGAVKIGLILDMSGPYADVTGAGSRTAARMAVEDVGGRVLGKPIEVLAADHLNKPEIASAKAAEWFDRENLDALVDVAASSTALAAQDVAKQRNKIIILNGPGTTRLTNESCGPQTVHYAYDTHALASGTGLAVVKQGGDSWFFLTVDYTFGHDLEKDTTNAVRAGGGTVLGSVRHPLNTADFSSFLLQVQASKAKVVGLANAGTDMIQAIKQAHEFGLTRQQKLAALLIYITDIHSLGLGVAQGMLLTEGFYWDMNDETRAWSRRYFERMGKMPNMSQAGVYSATSHYLKAVATAGTDETAAVMQAMRAAPIDDFYAKNGRIREDGRMVHDMYLVEVKKPEESKAPWDYYKILATIPGDQAFQPLSASRCPLVRK